MTSHFGLMVAFAAFVSATFATLMRDTPAEQLRFGGQLFAGFVVGGVVLGWALLLLPL